MSRVSVLIDGVP